MSLIVEPYKTPEGSLDFPFAYVFNATGIADGQAQLLNQAKPTQGDSDFILRRIVGVNTCVDTKSNGGKFNYKNASGVYAIGNTSSGVYPNPNWVVLPEKLYEKNTQIAFDLYQTLRASNACGGGAIFTSYIAFFGLKRFAVQSGYRSQRTPYPYREQKYSYSYTFTLNQAYSSAGGVNPYVRQSQQMENYDFELQRVAISYANSPGVITGLTSDDFQIMMYDANMHQLSDLPLNQSFINAANASWHSRGVYQGLWPVPSLVYPAGSAITFDIYSLLCSTSVPQTYNIAFEGVWRVPCR